MSTRATGYRQVKIARVDQKCVTTSSDLAAIRLQCDAVDATIAEAKAINDKNRQQAERLEYEMQAANASLVSASLARWIEDCDSRSKTENCDARERTALGPLVEKLQLVSSGTINDRRPDGSHRRGFRVRYSFDDEARCGKLRMMFVHQLTQPTTGPMTVRYSVTMTHSANGSSKTEFSVGNDRASKERTQNEFCEFMNKFHPGILKNVRPRVMEAFLIDMLSRGEEMAKASVGVARTLRLFAPHY